MLGYLFAQAKPFDVTISGTGWFGDSVVFVRPCDSAPLAALVAAIATAFPDWPLYGGIYDAYTPHMTIGHDQPQQALKEAEADVVRKLPLAQRVESVALWYGPPFDDDGGAWRLVGTFPLSGV